MNTLTNNQNNSASSEAAQNADFSHIRYAQCWEDADVLLNALDIQPGDTCLSIASAGDNALAMLSRSPKKVIALDLSKAQLACLALRVAAYRTLTHGELLELIGSRSSIQRITLYERCRSQLSKEDQAFWDYQRRDIENGIGHAGKFESYFRIFRRNILPLVHSEKTIHSLLSGGTLKERQYFYEKKWNTWRWRLLFAIFFSRNVMGCLGRDPAFFKYVEGRVSKRILERVHYALTELNPAENPYLQWILKEHHTTALPYALRPENFDRIREQIDRIEWHAMSIEDYLNSVGPNAIDRYNLSDIFEYMSEENYHRLLERLVTSGRSKGRLVYWNMLAPRSCPESMTHQLTSLHELADTLFKQDKAFFYNRLIIEEIR